MASLPDTTPYTPTPPNSKPWPLSLDDMHDHNLQATHTAHRQGGAEHPPTMTICTKDGDEALLEVAIRLPGGFPLTLQTIAIAFIAIKPVRFVSWSVPTWFTVKTPATSAAAAADPLYFEKLADAGDPDLYSAYLVGNVDLDAGSWSDAFRLSSLIPPLDEGAPWTLDRSTIVGSGDGGRIASAAKVLYERGRQLAGIAPDGLDLHAVMAGLTVGGFVLQAMVPHQWMSE